MAEEEEEEEEERRRLLISKLKLSVRKKLVNCYAVAPAGRFGKFISNTFEVLKSDAGKGLRRSVGPNVC
jgi:hypothetical protein